MSALAVLVSSHPSEAATRFAQFKQLVEELKHVPLPCEVSSLGAFGARDVPADPQMQGSIICDDGKSWVVWIGHPFVPDASALPLEQLIKHYPFDRESVLQNLEGQFVLIGFNVVDNTLYVATDAVGSPGVYYALGDRELYVATSALAIAKMLSSVKPDIFAIESFLFTGGYIGDHTLFAEITRVRGGRIYAFEDTHLQVKQWHSFVPEGSFESPDKPLEALGEHLSDLLVRTLRESLRSTSSVWCQLTAGYDARVVAAALSCAGLPFSTTVYGREGDIDVEGARSVCSACGWAVHVCGTPPDWGVRQWEFVRKSVGLTDGHYDVLGFARHNVWDSSLLRTSPHLCSGIGGELLRDFFWRHEFLRTGRSTTLHIPRVVNTRFLSRVAGTVTSSQHRFEAYREKLTDWINDELAPHAAALNTTKLDLLYLGKVTRFGCEYLSGSMPYLNVIIPFLFRRILDFSLSLPPRVRQRLRLIRQAAVLLNPAVANLSTSYGHPLAPMRTDNFYRFVPWAWDDLKRVVRKVAQVSFGVPLFREKTDGSSTERKCIAKLLALPEVSDSLSPSSMRTRGLYDKQGLEGFMTAARDGGAADAGLLGRMLTLELVFRTTQTEILG